MKVFVDNVAALVVEACLLAHLSEILSPTSILEMPTDIVTSIAGEPEDSQAERERLTRKLAVLKAGLDICKRYASRPVRSAVAKVAADNGGNEKTPSQDSVPEPLREALADLSIPPYLHVTPPLSAAEDDRPWNPAFSLYKPGAEETSSSAFSLSNKSDGKKKKKAHQGKGFGEI